MDVSLAIADPNLSEFFTVLRSVGHFDAGGWVEDKKITLKIYGVVSVAAVKDIDMTEEADQVRGMANFWARQEIFVTHENGSDSMGTSDVLVWRGEEYRVMQVAPYGNRGYWKGTAQRKLGA